jgi:hypothetical protein
VFLAVWSVGWISFFVWAMTFPHVDWSEWPTLAATVFGYSLSIFLLSRLFFWMNRDFVRSDWRRKDKILSVNEAAPTRDGATRAFGAP